MISASDRQSPIHFSRPTATLPVSLTGAQCALNCAHCGGHYLAHMRAVQRVDAAGYRSLLISGGCDPSGRVPINNMLPHVESLRDGRRLNWHVGFAEEPDLQRIAPLVDVISFDVVGDRATAREVYGLDLDLDDYLRQFSLLRSMAPTVPHVTFGLRGGRFSGEERALRALASLSVPRLVLLILIPTPGTRYADVQPPDLEAVRQHMVLARSLLPDTRIDLGCMRPHGRYQQAVDVIAVESGLDGVVNPSRAAVVAAEQCGRPIVWGDECCALL